MSRSSGGGKHVAKRDKTTVLTADQARTLLDSIGTGSIVALQTKWANCRVAVLRMIKRRAKAAGLPQNVSCHTLRAQTS